MSSVPAETQTPPRDPAAERGSASPECPHHGHEPLPAKAVRRHPTVQVRTGLPEETRCRDPIRYEAGCGPPSTPPPRPRADGPAPPAPQVSQGGSGRSGRPAPPAPLPALTALTASPVRHHAARPDPDPDPDPPLPPGTWHSHARALPARPFRPLPSTSGRGSGAVRGKEVTAWRGGARLRGRCAPALCGRCARGGARGGAGATTEARTLRVRVPHTPRWSTVCVATPRPPWERDVLSSALRTGPAAVPRGLLRPRSPRLVRPTTTPAARPAPRSGGGHTGQPRATPAPRPRSPSLVWRPRAVPAAELSGPASRRLRVRAARPRPPRVVPPPAAPRTPRAWAGRADWGPEPRSQPLPPSRRPAPGSSWSPERLRMRWRRGRRTRSWRLCARTTAR